MRGEERCCHIPFTAPCLLLLKGFIAFTDQSDPDRGWSNQTLSQTSSVWCCYSRASVAQWCLNRKAFYQRIWGNSSWLSFTSGRKETECIQRRSKWSSNIQGVPAAGCQPAVREWCGLFQNSESEKFQPSISYSSDPCWACPSLVESPFFAQIFYTTLYMS